MEIEIRNNIEKILHMSKVILVTPLPTKLQVKLECDSTLEFVVLLYINIRLNHVLRVNIKEFNSGRVKRT